MLFATPFSEEGGFSVLLDKQDAEYLLYALDIRPEPYKNQKIAILTPFYFENLLKVSAVNILNGNEVEKSNFDFDNLVKKGIENGKIIAEFARKYPIFMNDDNVAGIGLFSNENVSEIDEFEHNKQINALGIRTEGKINEYKCNSEKNQVAFIKNLLNEDVSFLSFLLNVIFGNENEVGNYKQYEKKISKEKDFWKEINKIVSDDTFEILKKWKFVNNSYDYSNVVLAPYDKSLEIPENNKDLYSEYENGKVSLLQIALFHAYLLCYLKKRFVDYMFLPQNILRNDNFLTSIYHRGFDVILGIVINVELQLGIHLVFNNISKDISDIFEDDKAWFKKIAYEYSFESYKALPNGLRMLLNSYLGTIDQIMDNYDPYAEFNCVYLNNHPMYKEEMESLAEIVYMNLPQGNGFFLDYKNALRAMCAGIICGNADTRRRLFRLSLQLCTQMDFIKIFFGIEKSEALFNSEKNSSLSKRDFVKSYHEAVFYWFDEKNGINHGIYPENLDYIDDNGYDALLRTDGYWRKNPSLRERYYYDYRHLRMELFEMLSGTFLDWKDKSGFTKGVFPLIPFYLEGNLKFNIGGEDKQDHLYINKNTIEKMEYRLLYLGYIREIDEIPVASFREYMTAPVFFSWLKQKEDMEVIRQKNSELEQTNENLKKQMKINHDLVRNIAHSAVNYLNSERLANTGVSLHEAKDGNPTLEKLHSDGLLLMLQSEQEEYLTRQLKDAVRKYQSDTSEEEEKVKEVILEDRIRSSVSRNEGMSIEDVFGFALRTVIARILFRKKDEKGQYIRKKLNKSESDWTNLTSTFITDVLAEEKGSTAFKWWVKNWNVIELKVSDIWKKIKIFKDGEFYDLILEIVTELMINALAHGDIQNGITIEFGQENNEKGRPLWAFISSKNKIGNVCEIKSGVGLASLNNDILLLNHGERSVIHEKTDKFYETRVWLNKKLLVAK